MQHWRISSSKVFLVTCSRWYTYDFHARRQIQLLAEDFGVGQSEAAGALEVTRLQFGSRGWWRAGRLKVKHRWRHGLSVWSLSLLWKNDTNLKFSWQKDSNIKTACIISHRNAIMCCFSFTGDIIISGWLYMDFLMLINLLISHYLI